MLIKKLTKEEREQLRRRRVEMQLINKEAKEKCFEYVVNPPEIPKIAFGSGIERDCLPQKGPALSSYMRRIQGEILSYPGPYEHVWRKELIKKLPSTFGHVFFVSKQQRLPPTEESKFPPIGAYDVDVHKKFKPAYVPFGSSAKRADLDSTVPGPPTYSHHIPFPKQKRILAFGTSSFLWPAVHIFCKPINTAKCHLCQRQPYGDYFYNPESKLDMCRGCMKSEINKLKECNVDLFKRQQAYIAYRKFQPARYCDFYHNHNGTTAAVQLISRQELRKKIRSENYLYRFQRQLA